MMHTQKPLVFEDFCQKGACPLFPVHMETVHNLEVEDEHAYQVSGLGLVTHNICQVARAYIKQYGNPNKVIYTIVADGKYYVGSTSRNLLDRLGSFNHPAKALLNNPNVKITIQKVKGLGKAKTARERNLVKRAQEQKRLDLMERREGIEGRLNQIKALTEEKMGDAAKILAR